MIAVSDFVVANGDCQWPISMIAISDIAMANGRYRWSQYPISPWLILMMAVPDIAMADIHDRSIWYRYGRYRWWRYPISRWPILMIAVSNIVMANIDDRGIQYCKGRYPMNVFFCGKNHVDENAVTNIGLKSCCYHLGGKRITNSSLLTFETFERYIKTIIYILIVNNYLSYT